MAERIQLRRTKGWRLPQGAAVVARPSKWGNPFPVDVFGRHQAVKLHRRWLVGDMSMHELSGLSTYVSTSMVWERRSLLDSLADLRGRDLACWCHPKAPCHADVLLEMANAPLRCEPTP